MSSSQAGSYKNVMELVVDEEIDHQTQHFSADFAQSLNRIELATFALNRLPPLYASSVEGVSFQYERAKRELKHQVQEAVQQALQVVAERPERRSTPFHSAF
ncbi:late competence development ComFB family protein [Lyngbya confervoides]|uniref:Late competence development ComFB family protein n=1 Tax=Lyngbya confervoides BDU141951 TaxID=1574623 RepID=A0ABD4T4V0_9CYAN|nr:late competence development ComFB family protein [Lyngbya confervoides]MCM1983528.1 late competence development ComFB family protein [Lyngbya confervoides BDU141951]